VPTAGPLAFLVDAYDEDEAEGRPVSSSDFIPASRGEAAVFHPVRKDGQPEQALAVHDLLAAHFPVHTTRPVQLTTLPSPGRDRYAVGDHR